jgi:hypothetical protein
MLKLKMLKLKKLKYISNGYPLTVQRFLKSSFQVMQIAPENLVFRLYCIPLNLGVITPITV